MTLSLFIDGVNKTREREDQIDQARLNIHFSIFFQHGLTFTGLSLKLYKEEIMQKLDCSYW